MKKTYLSFLLVGFASLSVWGSSISSREALIHAEKFFSSKHNVRSVSVQSDLSVSKYKDALYIVNNSNGGWILVSADDRVPEMILGYSMSGNLSADQLPEGIKAVVNEFVSGIRSLDNENPRRCIPVSRSEGGVAPLLGDMSWDQGSPYNSLFPKNDDGEPVLAGCVNVAEGQIMYYHKYPATGQGSHSYSWNGTEYSVNFSKSEYDWDWMKPHYEGNESKESIEAVSKLLYDIAISNDSSFGPLTGAVLWGEPMVRYFDYDPGIIMVYRDKCSREYYENLIRKELDASRPVYIQAYNEWGGGHAFVCDGYNSEGYFHYNMGGGSGGYFLSTATGWDHNPMMICNIKPNEDGAPGIWAGSDREFYWTEGNKISCRLRGDITSNIGDTIEVALAVKNKADGTIKYYIIAKEFSKFFYIEGIEFNQDLPDGEYTVYPVYHIYDEPWEKVCFPDEAGDHIDVSVKNGVKTYTNFTTGGVMDEGVVQIDGVYYRIVGDEAIVTCRNKLGNSYSGDVVIPSEVEYNNVKYPVVGIGEQAFIDSRLNTVTIGNNVRAIEYAAFGNTKIGRINFAKDSKLTHLKHQAFQSCTLDLLCLPYGLETMDFLACGDSHIRCIDLPETVKNMSVQCIENPYGAIKDVTVHWSSSDEMPQIDEGALYGFYDSATLHVPKGCVELYRNNEIWNVFGSIVDDADSGVMEINSEIDNVKIIAENGMIRFEGLTENTNAVVYNVQGVKVGECRMGEIVKPGKGIFLVHIGKNVVKVLL
ncbi:MAG: C10 family peptidase [Muribaculaceae bacterium]|nr:C10 family peptidase [Muribaculaceae bacterium]